jgi:aromatic-L-amino-acid decarboxylase
MDLDEFRRHGHALVDWMADYLENVERRPVRAQVRPGAIAEQLPAAPPAAGEPLERIFADFERIVLPGMTHWQHPSFFAYFPANSARASVLAEMLTATLALRSACCGRPRLRRPSWRVAPSTGCARRSACPRACRR